MKRFIMPLLVFAIMSTVSSSQAQGTAADSNNRFAFDCLKNLGAQKEDIAFSPFSAWIALTMTSGGAAKTTLKEMAQVLHYPADEAKIHALASEWTAQLASLKDIELRTANRLWLSPSFELTPAFDQLTKEHYKAGVERISFNPDKEKARARINKWVEEQTADRIKNLLQPNNVTTDTKLVLTNAVYFKAKWEREFNPQDTRPLPFTQAEGEIVQTPMMLRKAMMPYYETSGFQAVRIPYAGGATSMIVVLPAKGKAPVLTANEFSKLRSGLADAKVVMRLPRFTLNARVDMIPMLNALGMNVPFTNAADFSNMTTKEPLKIGAVIHQTFIKVGEKGTEAAAATSVAVVAGSAAPRPEVIKEMFCDRPFLFFITHDPTGGILFAGRVDHPEKAGAKAE